MPHRLTILAAVLIALAACDRPRAAQSQPAPAVAVFRARVAADGELAFLSWDGKWIGTDSDIGLVLRPDGAAELTSFGYAVQQFKGTYRISDTGEVTARFDQFGRPWPILQLDQAGDSFVLRPKDPPDGNKERWTFRSVRRQDSADGNEPGR